TWQGYARLWPQTEDPPTAKKENLAKDSICHHYRKVGHWRRNCPVYLAEFEEEQNYTYVFITTQRLKVTQKLKKGAFDLYVGNGSHAAVEHCHRGHIKSKRITKLQHDGLLESIDDESFDKYVSCLSDMMAQKPLSHVVKRANDLLGVIHADVCGPFSTTSREVANYYVIFTDDFSRYVYVYLIKHKHEVFETFKAFQNKVENQLGKTIKSL
ncbi:retrotransposon protein, putative, ty1-copia subclass, partial [Tanacetum coccineum]